jgi:hypothetical protein
MALSSLVKGTLLASRYEILSPLGKGGMGIVYKAYDRELEETVAVKVLPGNMARGSDLARRFRSEIKLARKVRHRNVCSIHEYGQAGPLLYIAMELIEGPDLKHILTAEGALPPARAFDVAAQIAEGLQAIHDEGIVHRDLKTTNIMLDRRGVVRLMDFGIAKQWQTGGGVTDTGQVVGTPDYMSPEQVRGGQDVDFRSDIYSLGVVVFELFTGRVPFRGETPAAVLMKHLQEPPPLESGTAFGLPRDVIPILRKALAKNAGDRYQKARVMAHALREAEKRTRPDGGTTSVPMNTATIARPSLPSRSGAGPTAVPTAVRTAVRTVVDHSRRHPAGAAVLGLLVVAVAAAGTVEYRRVTSAVAPGMARPGPPPSAPAEQMPPLVTAPATVAPAPQPTPEATTPRLPQGSKVPMPASKATPPPRTVDPRAAEAARIESDRQAALRRITAQTDDLLDRAEKALESQNPEAAIALYDEVLRLDRQNQVARMGRITAINVRAAAQAGSAPPAPAAAKTFVSGTTQARSAETRTAETAPPGFDPSSGIAVTRSTQAAAMPGLVLFEVEPAAVKPGDKYTITIVFVNGGSAPIEIRTMRVTTIINGGKSADAVPPRTRVVAPRERAVLLSTQGVWKDEVKDWSVGVEVFTAHGETYQNRVSWK